MKKYRIIEETEYVSGEKSKTRFYIQEKFLTMWFNVSLKFADYRINEMSNGFVISKREPVFTKESHAKEILNKIKNPIKEIYKGCVLERVFDDNFNDCYINNNRKSISYGIEAFECTMTIDELKRNIDKRDITHKYRIIKEN